MKLLLAGLFLAALLCGSVYGQQNCEFNLACPPDPDTDIALCLEPSQVCDGFENCTEDGADEGDTNVALECNDDRFGGVFAFFCGPGSSPAFLFNRSQLCNGIDDCDGGIDETFSLCEDNCRAPFNGGCNVFSGTVCEGGESGTINCPCAPGYIADQSGSGNCFPDIDAMFETSVYDTSEDEGVVEVCVTASGVQLDAVYPDAVDVILETTSGSATGGADYDSLVNFALSFTNASTTQCVNITITDDTLIEDVENFVVSITGVTGLTSNASVDITDVATVNIADNDLAIFEFVGDPYSVAEIVLGGVVTVTVQLASNSATLGTSSIDVTISTVAGVSATESFDYDPVNTSVTFLGGSTPLTQQTVDIPITDDTFVEFDELFDVEGAVTDPIAQFSNGLNSDTATVTIVSEDVAIFAFNPTAYSVGEGIGSSEAFLELVAGSGELTFDIDINITSSDDSATAGSDYDPVSETLTFPTASRAILQFPVPFTITNDQEQEPVESFTLTATTSALLTQFSVGGDSATVTIEDNEVVFELTQMAYDTAEGEDFVTVSVELVGGGPITSEVTISLATTANTAIGTDFGQVSADVVFAVGAATGTIQSVNITIADDNFVERSEDFLVDISSPDPDVLFDRDSASVTITDNDIAVFEFTESSYTQSENVSPLPAAVRLAQGILTFDISVQVTTMGGTAEGSDVDYSDLSTSLTFSDGTSPGGSGAEMSFDVDLIDDSIVENTETFNLSASTAEAQAQFNLDTAEANIEDDDSISVAFQQSSYTVGESEPNLEVCAVITASSLAPGVQALIRIESTDVTATAPDDYIQVLFNVIFTGAAGVGNLECVIVVIEDDLLLEDDETFTLSFALIPGEPVVLGSPDTTTVTIVDDETLMLALGQSSYTVNEDVGVFNIEVEFLGSSSLSRDVDFTLQSSSGSATGGGEDYDDISIALTFPDGSPPGATVLAQVTISNDSSVENDEIFSIQGSSADPDVVFAADRDVANVTILDDDVALFGFQPLSYSAAEGETVDVTVVLLEGILDGEITVNVGSSDINALAGFDYNSVSLDLTFDPGSSPGASMSFSVVLLSDDRVEVDEQFALNLSPVSAGSAIASGQEQATVTIVDTSIALFGFDPLMYTVAESDGSVTLSVELIIGSVDRDVVLVLFGSDDTALAGSDYGDNIPSVTFPAGSNQGAVVTTIVTIIPGPCVEEDEIFRVLLSTSDANAQIDPNQEIAVVTITDNSRVTIGFDELAYSVVENVPEVLACVALTSGCLETTVELMLGTSSNGEAEDGSDYSGTSTTLSFNETTMSNTMLCVAVPIIDDLTVENTENFAVELSLTPSNDPIDFSPQQSTVTIFDDDEVEIRLEEPPPVYEGPPVQCVDVTINLVGMKEPGLQCQVTVFTQNDTAQDGVDYVGVNQVLTFSSAMASQVITICILDDPIPEEDECFYVMVESANPLQCEAGDPVKVTIRDDEDCDDNPCDPNAECDEVDGPNNFNCTCIPPFTGNGFTCNRVVMMGDDPHFSIVLPSGKLLCYTVQGEHGFAFNLISNEKVYMNAMFVPDSRREEVTWLGSMGIVIQNSGYKRSNSTIMRFAAIENKIYINNKVVLHARNIEKLTFSDGKLTISEAPPVEGHKYPKVQVDLQDIELSFSIQFLSEHLDLFWHGTGPHTDDSHGLIGQFFRKGIEIDEVRKFLILPGKEPVPVMRRPVWSFMEREVTDDQLCWTAMNPGYQGEGLIDGTYFDYLVDDVLSTDFRYQKQ